MLTFHKNGTNENKDKNQSKKPITGKRRQAMLSREEVKLLRNLKCILKRQQQKKYSKKTHDFSSNIKSIDERINSNPKAPKMTLKSGSLFKSVAEKERK